MGHGSEMEDVREHIDETFQCFRKLRVTHVMCISACYSSAQSERDFSCVGLTITDTRSRLSAEKVESLELIRWGLRGGLI